MPRRTGRIEKRAACAPDLTGGRQRPGRSQQLRVLSGVQSSVVRAGDPSEMLRAVTEAIQEAVPEFTVRARLKSLRGTTTVDGAPAARDVPGLSRLEVPLLCGQEAIGTLVIEAARQAAFEGEWLETMQLAAAIVGAALDNHRLFERIEQEKSEWASTFDAITDMVSIHDDAFRLLRGNRALWTRLAAPAYEFTGKTCEEIFAAILGGAIQCPHAEAERTRRAAVSEILQPGGDAFRLTALPRFAAGRLTYSVHLFEDITEERRLRDQLLQSEKMSAVGQLVSGVAHELNNPLAGVMGYTQLMLTRPLDAKVRNELERVFSEAQRASKIVQNLLTFARKHKPEKRYLGINGIVEKTLELRSYELRVSNIEVKTELEPDLPRTLVDFHQMQQVILNIVTNAEQAMLESHGRGRLDIRTRTESGRIVLRIEDDGPGIPTESRQRIFEPFFTTKPVGQGTGLGLSICDGIVKEHGGSLRVEGAPGKGAMFIIELPILGAERPAERAEASVASVRCAGGRSILVVDDEPSIQDLLVEILTLEGYQVDTASSGATALTKLGARRYDLIISDLKMPGVGGAELFETIRATRPEQAEKILFTSGDTASSATDAFLRRYGHVALLKPFTMDDLRSALGRFFDRTA